MDRNFGGVIWTNHALERLRARGIKQGDAWAAFRNPDQSRKGTVQNSWVYYKTYGSQRIEVVASKNDKGEWVILSVWSRPVYQTRGRIAPVSWWDRFLEMLLQKTFGWLKKY